MKKLFNIIFCAALLAFPLERSSAQEAGSYELSLTGGFGLSTLKYDLDNGDSKQKTGGNAGVGFNYFLSNKFSLNTGLELSFYNSKAEMNEFSDAARSYDSEGKIFELQSVIKDYEEKQNAMFLTIPVMAQFQTKVINDHQVYAALGVKIGIPVSSKYKSNSASLETVGYYAEDDLYIDEHPAVGFGMFNGKSVEKDLDLKIAFLLAAEAGMKWSLTDKFAVYTGVFVDYGLNDIRDKKNQAFLIYNPAIPTRYENNSITGTKFGDKITPFAAGLKIRLAFNAL